MYKTIAIEREYASGGRQIGDLLAKRLGIKFYNDEILSMAAAKIGVTPDNVQHLEEAAATSLLYNLAVLTDYTYDKDFGDRLYYAEKDIIKELSQKESNVIVGRCAVNILAGQKDCLKVFIYANQETRIKRAVQEYAIPEAHAASELKKNDKRRNAFYDLRADKRWLDMTSYDICLDSGSLGIQKCVDILADLVQEG